SAAAKPATSAVPASAMAAASAKPAAPASPAASGAPGATANGVKLIGAGSTFDFPLFTKVFDAWGKQAGGQVNYQSVGSGAGIEQLTKKTVDFGASDAIMTADQEKAAGAPVVHIPVTLGAVAVGYNVPGVKDIKLDPDTLSSIYLGTIKSWDDPKIAALNPDLKLPKTAIAPVERSDGSGTTYIFTNYLSAVSSDWKSKVGADTSVKWPVGFGGKGSEGVAGQVSQTPGGVGYFELAYAKQNNISTVVMKNQAGKFVPPSVAGATAAAAGAAADMPADGKAIIVNAPGDAAYPISGFSWALSYQDLADATKGKALIDLFTYTTTKGQQFSEDLSYAQLPPAVQSVDAKIISSLTLAGKAQ
ncbi:MAG: phosphate ABC transporter substrate-binding protein PstS, partial [Chloroflexota bacterium]